MQIPLRQVRFLATNHERPIESPPGRLFNSWQFALFFPAVVLVTLAWVFFRARNVGEAAYILTHFLRGLDAATTGAQLSAISAAYGTNLAWAAAGILILFGAEFLSGPSDPSEPLAARPGWIRWSAYYAIILLTLLGGVFEQSAFIYFQF